MIQLYLQGGGHVGRNPSLHSDEGGRFPAGSHLDFTRLFHFSAQEYQRLQMPASSDKSNMAGLSRLSVLLVSWALGYHQ